MAEPVVQSEERKRAVLAAVLAVKRGFLSPEEAMGILEQAEQPRPGSNTLLNVAPVGPIVIPQEEASSLVLAKAPIEAREEIQREVEEIARDPKKAAETLAAFSGNSTKVKQTLLSVAATTDRVQKKPISARLPQTREVDKRYEIQRELARGGMGRVLIALDNAVGREVALKELLSHKGGTSIMARATSAGELAERFLREAKVTGQLEHPNIIPVYEIGARDDGSVFYTMKLVRGKTLADRIGAISADKSLGESAKFAARLKLLDAFVDVCNAVAYAHSRGVIHRDLKPANVMLGDYGETLVLDWGLARVKGQADEAARRAAAKKDTPAFSPSLIGTDSESRTLDGSIIGTPAYMPPEQARGELANVDEQSDVYSLGAILYEIIAARAPYEGESANLILGKVQNLPPDPLAALAPLCPPDLRALVEKAMAREKAARLPSAQAFGDEVRAFRAGRPLTVYRYSRGEKVARFVAHNKLASAVAALSLVIIVTVAAVAFFNVLGERDLAQFQLARAEQAERERKDLERAQSEERKSLVLERKRRIEQQKSLVASLVVPEAQKQAGARLIEIKSRGNAVQTSLAELSETRALIAKLMAAGQACQTLLDLYTQPIAGHPVDFIDRTEVDLQRKNMCDCCLLAASLATANEDFALAEFILGDLRTLSSPEFTREVDQDLERAKGAQLKRHEQTILQALATCRDGLGVQRTSGNLPPKSLEDLVYELVALRERQTVELLDQALVRHIRKAEQSQRDVLWEQPERDEIALICRVLGRLELPELTAPVLAKFMAVVTDARLAIECGQALCHTASPAADAPLSAVRQRLSKQPYIWNQIAKFYHKVPDPKDAPEPATFEQFLARAQKRLDKSDYDAARADADSAIKLNASSPEAYLLRSKCHAGPAESSLNDIEKALSLNPRYVRALVARSRRHWSEGKNDKALADTSLALEIDENDHEAWGMQALVKTSKGNHEDALPDFNRAIEIYPHNARFFSNRATVHFYLGDYERAVADCTRAIDLDPYLQEAWVNRASCRTLLDDEEGALADCGRLLELHPRYPWAYWIRGNARLRRKEFEAAIYDYRRAMEILPGFRQPLSYLCDALWAQGDPQAALAEGRNAIGGASPPTGDLRAQTETVLSYIEAAIAGEAWLDKEPTTTRDKLLKVAALAGRARRLHSGRRDDMRAALAILRDLASDKPLLEKDPPSGNAPMVAVGSMMSLYGNEKLHIEMAELLVYAENLGVYGTAPDAFNAACNLGQAMQRIRSRKLTVLGKDDDEATKLNAAIKSGLADSVGLDLVSLRTRALDWLDRAVQRGYADKAAFRRDPDLAMLRNDPRYDALLARIK